MTRTTSLAICSVLAFTLTWTPSDVLHAQSGKSARTAPSQDEVGQILVVGRVSSNPRKDYHSLKVLADYLADELRDQGITDSRIQFAQDNDMMLALLREGLVDVIPESVFPALTYAEQTGAKLLLREHRDGVASYRSILFTRKDSDIVDLTDLLGRTVAFEDRGSTSAHLVPHALLRAAGLPLVELAGPNQEPPPDAVGFVFAGSENNVIVWVHQKLVDAGAFSDVDWDQPNDAPPELRQDLKVFQRSESLPRSVMLVRGDLPPRLQERIKEVLLTAPDNPEGKRVLGEYKDVTAYDEFDGEAAAGLAAARKIREAFR